MPDAFSEIETRLRACEDALGALARRVRTLEDNHAISVRGPGEPDSPLRLRPSPVDYTGILSLTGRTCVVLGGAFLLRALTESRQLPSEGGVILGFAYAAVWYAAADHASRRRPISGLFHGVAGVLIAFPLLWEASMRFRLLPPAPGALALAGLTVLGLVVAWHRQLPVLAGLTTTGAVLTSLSLAFATGAVLPHLIVTIGLMTAVWWMEEARGWSWLKWPAALAANVIVLAIGMRAGSTSPLASPTMALVVVTIMIWVVLSIVAVRTMVRRRVVSVFDVVCTLVTLMAGTSACLAMAPHVGALAQEVVRWSLVTIGALGYGAAFVVQTHDPDARSAFHYYSTLGLLGLISGATLALPAATRDLTLILLAVCCVWLATRPGCLVLAVHSALSVVTVLVTAGVLSALLRIWLNSAGTLPAFPGTGWLVLAAALMGGRLPRIAPSRGLEWMLSMSRLALAIVVTMSVAGGLVVLLAPVVEGASLDPGRLATLKTVMLSGTAVALAVVRRRPYGAQLGWLAYPVLIAVSVKLLLEDFRVSPPATLFIALAFFGTALILTSRLARASRTLVS